MGSMNTGGWTTGPVVLDERPLPIKLDSLIRQRLLCGGDSCKRPKCKRCKRYVAFLAKEQR